MKPSGIWLPLVTPFKDGSIDFKSYRAMIEHYIGEGIHGIVPMGTTGEAPTLTLDESRRIVVATVEAVNGRVPVFIGVGGNDTQSVIHRIQTLATSGVAGVLSVSPYYNRPDQRGIYAHFKAISESTDKDLIVYNIPYRTGRAVENDTIRRLSELKNIVALKDASGSSQQTLELLLNPPEDFSILCGEDAFLYTALTHGCHGGILASAHLKTKEFIALYHLIQSNQHKEALPIWKDLMKFIPALFSEPNPAPLKYCLHKKGYISENALRLPMLPVTDETEVKLNGIIDGFEAAGYASDF